MKFEINPITVNGPKIRGEFFGTVIQNLLFGHYEKIFDKMAKIAMDSMYDFHARSFETKFHFLGGPLLEIQPVERNPSTPMLTTT